MYFDDYANCTVRVDRTLNYISCCQNDQGVFCKACSLTKLPMYAYPIKRQWTNKAKLDKFGEPQ